MVELTAYAEISTDRLKYIGRPVQLGPKVVGGLDYLTEPLTITSSP